jgi:hypothetical protein
MGNVLKFSRKKPKKGEEKTEDISVMVCGACEHAGFFLSVDGRIFCDSCLNPVAAYWNVDEENTVA